MNEYSFSIPLTNITLLYIYAISLRIILFDYAPISYTFWDKYVLPKLLDKAKNSNRKTTKKGDLFIFTNDSKQEPFWKGIYGVVYKLNACSFCKGCWGGYIIYSLFILNPNTFHLDLIQVIDFAMFSWSCGVVSLIVSLKLGV